MLDLFEELSSIVATLDSHGGSLHRDELDILGLEQLLKEPGGHDQR